MNYIKCGKEARRFDSVRCNTTYYFCNYHASVLREAFASGEVSGHLFQIDEPDESKKCQMIKNINRQRKIERKWGVNDL